MSLSGGNKSSYRSILKGTALFGGVQVFTILVNLLRGKLIALFLGPAGMGISSLLNVSTVTIQQFTCIGLNLSAVKDISVAKENGDLEQLFLLIKTVRRLLLITGAIGALISMLFCSLLSQWTFGNLEYKWHFLFLSIVVYFTTLSNGELAILQGVRELKKIASASIVGALVGLCIGVPLYFFYGNDGIVPAMIALSVVTYFFYRYNTRKIAVIEKTFSWKPLCPIAKKMMTLGIVMMIATLLGTLANYVLNATIGRFGSIDDVGLYQAANSITNQYVGLVFAAMSVDFFPRLAAVCSDNSKVCELVNQQSEIVILIVVPLLILLIITAPLIIRLLLTDAFLPVVSLLRWMSIGVFFKAIAFPMGYISFSKGDKKTFFWLEGVWGNLFTLVLNITFYHFWGLEGIGISFCLSFFVSCVVYVFITKRLYAFRHTFVFLRLILLLLFFVACAFLSCFFYNDYFSYLGWGISFFGCTSFCLYELNKRLKIFKHD